MRDEVLAYEARRRLYLLVDKHPGLHLRELERVSGMPLSTLRYHLAYLERHELISAQADKNLVRYFARRALTDPERQVLAALRQSALRRVLLFLLQRGGSAAYRDIAASLAVPPSTLAVHLSELVRRGLLERAQAGRHSTYRIRDPEGVLRLLYTYRGSFLDTMVDHLLAAVYDEEDKPAPGPMREEPPRDDADRGDP